MTTVDHLRALSREFNGERYIRQQDVVRMGFCSISTIYAWRRRGLISPVMIDGRLHWPLIQAVTLLTARAPRRQWTQQESDLLLELYGTMPVPEIARQLNRKPKNIHEHARILGVREFSNTGRLTTGELARCLGVHLKTVWRWCTSYRLRHQRLRSGPKTFRLIDPADLSALFKRMPRCYSGLPDSGKRWLASHPSSIIDHRRFARRAA
ncbi:MAG: hypothetical protein IT445_00085 [Phycisphaeraceae bacterium]|nr:hypothetical protein [Phycisphaeraceae bacterium]